MGTELPKGIGTTGRTAVTWAVAGGVGLGGFVVGLMTLSGNLSGNGLLVTSMALFIIGAALGFLHGSVLGLMGRPVELSWRKALGTLGLAALYTIPALAVGFLVAGWIAMTPIALYTHKIGAIAGCIVAWVVGAILLITAAVSGVTSLRAAYARWEERRYGTVLVAASFAALLILFLAERPVLWGINLRVTEVGAVLLALSMTLWFVGPMVTFALKQIKKVRVPGIAFDTPRGATSGVVVGLVAGAVLGLIAVPFAAAKYGIPTAGADTGAVGAVVLAVSAALVNEVLLRLFVVTAAAALVLRWHRAHREEAAVLAVIIATVLQVVLYIPGVLAIGFPNALSATAFVVAAVALPAAVFGVLFWKRGLATAIIADATALVALALLAA
jgi:hypothetical protein